MIWPTTCKKLYVKYWYGLENVKKKHFWSCCRDCLTIQLDNSMTKNICSLHFFYENCIKKKVEADRWERGGDRRLSRYKTKKAIFCLFSETMPGPTFFWSYIL